MSNTTTPVHSQSEDEQDEAHESDNPKRKPNHHQYQYPESLSKSSYDIDLEQVNKVWLGKFARKPLENNRTYVVPNQISESLSIAILKKPTYVNNIFSLMVWFSEDANDISFLSITKCDGITFIYNISNSYFSRELSEFLTDKTNIFILWDAYIDSSLKKYFPDSINVKIDLTQLLSKIKTKTNLNPIFNDLDVMSIPDYAEKLFKNSSEKLKYVYEQDLFLYISLLSCCVFDTYCLIEQEILCVQNLYPNHISKQIIWIDLAPKSVDIGVNTDPVTIVPTHNPTNPRATPDHHPAPNPAQPVPTQARPGTTPVRPPPTQTRPATIPARPPPTATRPPPVFPPNFNQSYNSAQRYSPPPPPPFRSTIGNMARDVRMVNIEERFAQLIKECTNEFNARFYTYNSVVWDAVYQQFFEECKERLLTHFVMPQAEMQSKIERIRIAIVKRIEGKTSRCK